MLHVTSLITGSVSEYNDQKLHASKFPRYCVYVTWHVHELDVNFPFW